MVNNNNKNYISQSAILSGTSTTLFSLINHPLGKYWTSLVAQMVKNLPLGRSPGEENGNPLQCLCLENPMDRGAWWVTAHVSQTRLSNFHCVFTLGKYWVSFMDQMVKNLPVIQETQI